MSLAPSESRAPRMTAADVFARFGLWIIFAALMLVTSLLSDSFLTFSNLTNVARQISINALLAFGMTTVILTGGIDLSVGALVALAGVSSVMLDKLGLPFPVTVLGTLLIGAVVGSLNGAFTAYGRVAPFIVTLAAMTILRGLTLTLTNGAPLTGLSDPFSALANTDILGLSAPVWITALALLATWFLLRRTGWGRGVYALGSSENAATFAGLNVTRLKISVYAYTGLLAGLAALLLTSRLNSAQPTAGEGFELDAIAAVVVGGTSLAGGRGSVIGTLLGALIIGVLNNAMNLLNVNPFFQMIVKGAVILGALLLERAISARRT